MAVLLSLPCLDFTFLWDDYGFLANAMSGNVRDWLPRSDDPFYRPISRALYFGIVAPFGTGGAFVAHLLNLVYLATAVVLLTILGTRLRGRMFGLLTGVVFAGMAAIPTLVGWASCSQDLLAIDFVLAAFLARSYGRSGLSLTALALALLSKETSLTAVPALVGWDWIMERRPYRWGRHVASYGLLVLAWAVIHPAAKVLLARGLAPGATGYVGLVEPRMWGLFAGRYLLVLSNLWLGSFHPTWPQSVTLYLGLIVLGTTLAMFWLSTRLTAKPSKSDTRVSNRSTVILGVLLFIPSLLMTSTIINSWAPYYAAFPMLGVSLLAALCLERLPQQGQVSAVTLFLVLGIWARGSDIATTHITERSLRPSSVALKKIEAGFLTVVPRLEPNTDILLSVQVRGLRRVYAQLYAFQPPRLWYRDLSLRVLKPVRVKPSDRPVVLVVIPSNLDVVFLNPVTFQTVSASGNPPDYYACERALRALAVGLGASSPDRGMHLLLRIPNPTPEIKSAHMRAAAMLQLAAGHEAVAESLIAAAPPLSRQSTLNDLHVLLAEQPTGLIVDEYALRAFGIRQDDTETLRELAGWLSEFGYAEAAHRFASKLLALSPADPAGLRAMAVSDSLLVERRKWPEALL